MSAGTIIAAGIALLALITIAQTARIVPQKRDFIVERLRSTERIEPASRSTLGFVRSEFLIGEMRFVFDAVALRALLARFRWRRFERVLVGVVVHCHAEGALATEESASNIAGGQTRFSTSSVVGRFFRR